MSNMQKFGVVCGLVFAVALVMFMTCVERIDYGSVGVRFNLMGDDRGVSEEPITAGYAVVNPLPRRTLCMAVMKGLVLIVPMVPR